MTAICLRSIRMTAEIERVVQEKSGQTLQVYAEAEKIRTRWRDLNIALEDIISQMIEFSGTYGVAVAFEPAEAKAALLGECQQSAQFSACGGSEEAASSWSSSFRHPSGSGTSSTGS